MENELIGENKAFLLWSNITLYGSLFLNFLAFCLLLFFTIMVEGNTDKKKLLDLLKNNSYLLGAFITSLITFIGGGLIPSFYGLMTSLRKVGTSKPITENGINFREDVKDLCMFVSYVIVIFYFMLFILFGLFPKKMETLSTIIFFVIILIGMILIIKELFLIFTKKDFVKKIILLIKKKLRGK
ncbi:hypothetical protein MX593_08815 [Staphylococcus borealis]|uniref:hypothetical protein n=1 Tax=Staphylococcus borealis TaxID=2742203 RepID=UPI002DBBE30B|nr:hypothetical protein [Staphylococcus borealis]MEB6610573.1 hypothetical protein [Staphylococcus borealis]